jgi:hypothetical protein
MSGDKEEEEDEEDEDSHFALSVLIKILYI